MSENKQVDIPIQKVLDKFRSQLEKMTYQNIVLQTKHEQEIEEYQAAINDLQDKLKKAHTFNNKKTSSQKRQDKQDVGSEDKASETEDK